MGTTRTTRAAPVRRTATARVAAVPDSPVELPEGAVTYRLDTYRAEVPVTAFVLDTGENQIVISPPTGETLLTIAETSLYDARALLKLITGDQHDAVWRVIKDEPGGILLKLIQDLGRHFMINVIQAAPGGPEASPG